MDITKESKSRGKHDGMELFISLSSMFKEVLVLNYTDDIVNTISKDGGMVDIVYHNTPLSRTMEKLKKIVAPDDLERVMDELSYESMKQFCESGEMLKLIKLKMHAKDNIYRKCEIVVINNKDDYGRIIVTTGSRAVE